MSLPPDGPYVMTSDEVIVGVVLGLLPAPPLQRPVDGPRRVLERIILDQMSSTGGPCVVAFSGGRDSSLVLAVATHVARREGLEPPIPLTKVFPGVPDSMEHEWQAQLITHLGITDWQRVELDADVDIVGPRAQRHLREYGVVWPPAIAGDQPMLELARGGVLMDGEGGDDVLGADAHRIGVPARVLRHPWPPNKGRMKLAVRRLMPNIVRARWDVNRGRPTPWLTDRAAEQRRAALIHWEQQRRLLFSRSVRTVPRRSSVVLGMASRGWFARRYDVEMSSPLLHPAFVEAMARRGRLLGPGGRDVVLREIAGDLLPPDLISRRSKAVFNRALMGEHTRAFAESWDGSGVDPALVNVEELRRELLSERPNAAVAALLQRAWVGAEGGAHHAA